MPGIIANGKYSITNALHEDHALSVNHITVVARDSDLNTWSLKWDPNAGNYTITLDDGTGRVLDLILFNNRVMIHENLGTPNQRWTIHKIGSHHTIRNVAVPAREIGTPKAPAFTLNITGLQQGQNQENGWIFTPKQKAT